MIHSEQQEEVVKTLSVQPGDKFYMDVTTTENELVMHGKQEKPRIYFLKIALMALVEKISTKDPDASFKTLKVELSEILRLFNEIFTDNNQEEMNVLKLSLRKLGFSGKARLLSIIEDCLTINGEKKKLMKKMVLEEAP
ncbi:MAG: hypothetical protein HGA36_04535 [Candidatus Moranbacteria bacterium]|nr:hypothetical protein [Candidatus Moranbacteria bacterium]